MSGDPGARGLWRRASALLDEALELPPEERGAFLDRSCEGDAALKGEVESLLQADARAGEFLETAAVRGALLESAAGERAVAAIRSRAGEHAGPFRLVKEIGRGGMGSVWLGERDDGQFEQRVAVKLVLSGRDDERVVRGFLRERQILARLEDARIARLVDGGVLEDGVPYLAMEYVEGAPITEWADELKLPLGKRLELFLEVCAAVEAAHRAGVVHRDLKPSNILVTASGAVKLLDFGIARRLDAAGDGTRTLNAALTPAYAAPEQLRGSATTPATDVYALGLLLHELLTGERAHKIDSDSADELLRKVLSEDPTSPSAALKERSLADPRWRALKGDLDRIVLKALEKEPDRRYASAAELGEDVKRHLAGEPVLARSGRVYRLWKRARRRRVELLAAAAVGLALAIAAAAMRARGPSLRAQSFELLSTFAGSHRQPAYSPDGKRLAFVAEDASGVPQIFVKDLAGGEARQLTHGAPGARVPNWAPGGALVYSVPGQGIWTVSESGGTPRRLLERGVHPRLSKDGTRLVYQWRTDFFVAGADGRDSRSLPSARLSFPFGLSTPAISPDGKEVAFFRDAETPIAGDLWVAPLDGGEARRLTFDDALVEDPVYTPDGRQIVFSSRRGGSLTLWAIPAAGGKPVAITTGSGEDTDPDVSPDGRHLVYANARGVNALALLDPRTGAKRTLVEERGLVTHPSFSPDGASLAFFREGEGKSLQVFTIGRDGTAEHAVTTDTSFLHALPEWSKDGRTIAFYRHRAPPAAPDEVYARAPADGGPIETLARQFPTRTFLGAHLDPTGRFLVFPVLEGGNVARTVIRDLSTGAERVLPEKLAWPRWSEDGRLVAGAVLGRGIFVCPSDGGACRQVAGRGGDPRWSGGYVYYGRYADALGEGDVRSIEIRRVRPDGTGEEHVADLPGAHPVNFFFDVSPTGELAWNEYRPTRSELWTADLR